MDKVLGQATGFISFSEKGEKGDTGPAAVIISTTRYYALTTGTNQPTSWSYTMPDINTSANKGKFLWIKTVYTWSTAFTTENITCTYIGKDGASGTSVTIKGSFTSTDDLPTSGVNLGDGYIIGGDLWVYTGTETTDKTHAKGFEDVGQIKGDSGIDATQYYMHIAWMNGSDGTGFTTSNPDGAAYDYIGILVDTNPEDSTLYGDYNWTYVKGGKGDKGDKGTSVIGTDVTYQIGSSSTEPPTGDWHVDVQDITDEKPYLWTRTVFNYDDGTHSNPSYSVATRGTKGAVIRQHNGFESGEYEYLAGVGAEEYLDMVLVSGKWYRCTGTYKSSSPSVTDGHWSIVNNYTAIATQLLLADNATINMASSQQVNLTDSNGNLFGSFRHVANDEDIALWLGGKNANGAPFYVRKDGCVRMANANIYGKLETANANGASVAIEDGMIKVFGTNGVCNIAFGVNDDGVAVLSYYDKDGNWLYDLGPSQIDASKQSSSEMTSASYVLADTYPGSADFSSTKDYIINGETFSLDVVKTTYAAKLFGTKMYADDNEEISKNPHIGYQPFTNQSAVTLYTYKAAKLNNTYVKDDKYNLSALLAEEANGKTFTSTNICNGTKLINLASGKYFDKSASVRMAPIPAVAAESSGNTKYPAYSLPYKVYVDGVMTNKTVYSTIEQTGSAIS